MILKMLGKLLDVVILIIRFAFTPDQIHNDRAYRVLRLTAHLLNQAVGNDGNLPGGLSPDQFKGLVENPEVMTLLQSTKMQEAMKLMMTGGREELEQKIRADPELQETIAKLNSIMGGLQ